MSGPSSVAVAAPQDAGVEGLRKRLARWQRGDSTDPADAPEQIALDAIALCEQLARRQSAEGAGPVAVHIPMADAEFIYRVLNFYADRFTYEYERVGGVLAGCPRGDKKPIDYDMGHSAEEAAKRLKACADGLASPSGGGDGADAARYRYLKPLFKAPGPNDWPAGWKITAWFNSIMAGEKPGEPRKDIHLDLDAAIDAAIRAEKDAAPRGPVGAPDSRHRSLTAPQEIPDEQTPHYDGTLQHWCPRMAGTRAHRSREARRDHRGGRRRVPSGSAGRLPLGRV